MRARRWRSVYARSTNRAKIAKSSRDPDRTAGKLSVPMQRSTNPQVREAPRRASAKEISGLIKTSALIPRAALSSCNKIKIKYRRGCGALGLKRTTSMRRSEETDGADPTHVERARLKEEPVAPRASLKQTKFSARCYSTLDRKSPQISWCHIPPENKEENNHENHA